VKERTGWFCTGAVTAGWLACKGAGLLAWAKNIHPTRKLNMEATVIHTRMPFLMIFIFAILLVNSHE